MRIDGHCGPAVGGRHGIELPDPTALRPWSQPSTSLLADEQHTDREVAESIEAAPALIGPAPCEVCAVPVAAEYIAATGRPVHGVCRTQAEAGVAA